MQNMPWAQNDEVLGGPNRARRHPIVAHFFPEPGYSCCAADFANVSVADTLDRAFFHLDGPGACDAGWGLADCEANWATQQWDYRGDANGGKGHFVLPANVLTGEIAVTTPHPANGCTITNGASGPRRHILHGPSIIDCC
jgi:hypothetical protein